MTEKVHDYEEDNLFEALRSEGFTEKQILDYLVKIHPDHPLKFSLFTEFIYSQKQEDREATLKSLFPPVLTSRIVVFTTKEKRRFTVPKSLSASEINFLILVTYGVQLDGNAHDWHRE